MDIYCYHCGFVFNRDKFFNGKLIEEYVNVYGTLCPRCEKVVKPLKELSSTKNKEKLEMLKIDFLNKLRKKIGDT